MLEREPSSDLVAELQRIALSPIAQGLGFDYDRSIFRPPDSKSALGFEALRCCSGLLVAFTYPDAWPRGGRGERRLGKRAAALTRDAFRDDRGRDAISWATQRYGRVMAAIHRAAHNDFNVAASAEATADADEWLAGLVDDVWPVNNYHDALAFAQHCCAQRRSCPPDASMERWSADARLTATVEMLCIATWPDAGVLEGAFVTWSYGLDITFDSGVLSDWLHVANFWGNLIDPARRQSHDEVITSLTE